MQQTIYPATPGEVAAFLAALVPLITWAVGGLIRAWTERKQRVEAEWKRLHEIAQILYNHEHVSGLWGQILAIREMRRLKSRRHDAYDIATLAAIHFKYHPKQTDGTPIIVRELEAFPEPKGHDTPSWVVELRQKAAQIEAAKKQEGLA